MNSETLQLLIQHFSAEKEYLGDGYYRFRQRDEHHYELAFLVPGGCGSTTVHPQITIKKDHDNFLPVQLIDMEVTPIVQVMRSKETKEYLDQQLEQLINKFKSVKGLSD